MMHGIMNLKKKKVESSWFLFFSYHNDARSNTHQIHTDTLVTACCLKGDKIQFLDIFAANRVAVPYSMDLLCHVCYIALLEIIR